MWMVSLKMKDRGGRSRYLVGGDEQIQELIHHKLLLNLHPQREIGEDRTSSRVVNTIYLVEEC